MKKWILIILITILAVLTTVFSLTYLSRLKMNYISERNYSDENSGVVYHQQAVIVFGVITLILFLLIIFDNVYYLYQ